jgi:hypothetical protein
MHGPPRTRHRDIKLCLVCLAERPNRHAGNVLVDSLRLTGVTGDSYSLVQMQSGPIANNLAFIEYDLDITMLTTVRSSLFRNFCLRFLTFFVNRIGSPIASVIFSRSNTLNFRA